MSTAPAEAVEARDPGVFRLMVVTTYSGGTVHVRTHHHTHSHGRICVEGGKRILLEGIII